MQTHVGPAAVIGVVIRRRPYLAIRLFISRPLSSAASSTIAINQFVYAQRHTIPFTAIIYWQLSDNKRVRLAGMLRLGERVAIVAMRVDIAQIHKHIKLVGSFWLESVAVVCERLPHTLTPYHYRSCRHI